ncbi:hypothetical protein ACTXT7_003939 [Hymenolepis weldensis]
MRGLKEFIGGGRKFRNPNYPLSLFSVLITYPTIVTVFSESRLLINYLEWTNMRLAKPQIFTVRKHIALSLCSIPVHMIYCLMLFEF